MPEQPADEQQTSRPRVNQKSAGSIDQELESRKGLTQQTRTKRALLARSLQGLDAGAPLLVVVHLSTIALAVQDRARFEGALGERLQSGAWLVVGGFVVREALRVFERDARTPRALSVCVLLLWLLHALGGGTGQPLLGPIEYDGWCAAMSSTWLSVPWRALGHLVAIALTAIEAKQSWQRASSYALSGRVSGRFGAYASRTRAGLVWGLAVLIALLGSSSVFALATGSGAIF